MLVALPSAIAFGVTIFSPMGSTYQVLGAIAGLIGASMLGLVASTFGGTDRLITAPCAPAAAVLSALAVQFTAQQIRPEESLLLLAIVAFFAGVLQLLFGIVGL